MDLTSPPSILVVLERFESLLHALVQSELLGQWRLLGVVGGSVVTKVTIKYGHEMTGVDARKEARTGATLLRSKFRGDLYHDILQQVRALTRKLNLDLSTS